MFFVFRNDLWLLKKSRFLFEDEITLEEMMNVTIIFWLDKILFVNKCQYLTVFLENVLALLHP